MLVGGGLGGYSVHDLRCFKLRLGFLLGLVLGFLRVGFRSRVYLNVFPGLV